MCGFESKTLRKNLFFHFYIFRAVFTFTFVSVIKHRNHQIKPFQFPQIQNVLLPLMDYHLKVSLNNLDNLWYFSMEFLVA